MDTESIPRKRLRSDLYVAAAAAVSAIAATIVVEFLLRADLSLFVRAGPLYVYAVYVFTRKGGPYTRFDTVTTWVVLALVAGVAVVGYGGLA